MGWAWPRPWTPPNAAWAWTGATAAELIRHSGQEAAGRLACGAGTDQLTGTGHSLAEITAAYEQQCATVERAGAQVIVMGSRQLAAAARCPDDYQQVYGQLLDQLAEPAILHWLGPMFDPALAGYWGSTDLDTATDLLVQLVTEHAAAVDGVKVSLLDPAHEIALRRRLPAGVHCYTRRRPALPPT